ncbi:MAG: hypothetical protein MUD12_02325 [Spirochaetes bacterium]|jgi:hypothetical protein|nr:hypothetical protein [Spirochaetota bacterium]
MTFEKTMNEEIIAAMSPDEKIGLVSTISPEGLPHITLITTIKPLGNSRMALGEFSYGLSKRYMKERNSIGFLIMTLDKKMIRGKAKWAESRNEGPEYDMLNKIPMFRYNTYFGINTVHYLDVIGAAGPEKLPVAGIAASSLKTMLVRGGAGSGLSEPAMKRFAMDLVNEFGSVKFISFIGGDGFPVLIPVIQALASSQGRLVLNTGPYSGELTAIPEGTAVAVYCMNMKMESVLVRGFWKGVKRIRGIKAATVDVNWVYNSMPPSHGQVYPEIPMNAVMNF